MKEDVDLPDIAKEIEFLFPA